jgi:selenide,water dikinase
MKRIDLFTDGACSGNPGPGGWGALLRYGKHEKELSGGAAQTTNNRMEMMAVIEGLKAVRQPRCLVTVHTDSQYVMKGVTEYLSGWKKRGWKTSDKKEVKNIDLWQILDELLPLHKVEWVWVRGHSGHPENDPFDFGRIAAANSISDIYAMGGKPILAIAILGWPVEKLPASLAQRVLDGGRTTCNEAGISLAGGHSIDSPEPFFGLCVTGIVDIENLKKNNTAEQGDLLFITKPLGVGVLSTAQKRGLLKEELLSMMVGQMSALNKTGEELGKIKGVTAMTDITGFGILGHLIEMAEGSGLSAELFYNKLPLAEGVKELISQRVFPDATTRNWNGYSKKIKFEKGVNVMEAFTLLPDPQTNGGLLFSVKEDSVEYVKKILADAGLNEFTEPIGRMILQGGKIVEVKN